MTNKEIFEKFDKMHSYSFATIDGDYPEIRIAHFITFDNEGLYFQTMKVKPFYSQLKKTNKVAACALISKEGPVVHDSQGLSNFPLGYFIRVSGDIKELSMEALNLKSEKDSKFLPLVKDIERYPTMTTFVLHSFKGEVYDYDFEKKSRTNKIERFRFSCGGMQYIQPGFHIIEDKCISCGTCAKVCTFDAIIPGEKYSINSSHCDECGSCYSACPVNAIVAKTPLDEEYRKLVGKKIINYATSIK